VVYTSSKEKKRKDILKVLTSRTRGSESFPPEYYRGAVLDYERRKEK
jgi:hypothetical protein